MIEFGISKGKKFYIASFAQYSSETGNLESGLSIIILGLRVTFYDRPAYYIVGNGLFRITHGTKKRGMKCIG